MEYRKFGSTDLMVSEIGFGCNKLGNSIFAKTNFTDNSSLLNSAFHKGITLYDVAPTYSYGEAESILGKVFSSKRHEIVISTKVGRLPSSLARYGSTIRHLHPIISPLFSPFKSKLKKRSSPRFDFSSSHIIKSAEESLKRLQTDYIDIFFLHNPSLDVIQKGEVFNALERLKSQGKIRYYGVSIDTLEEANAALEYPIDGLQITFNIIQEKMALDLLSIINSAPKGILVKTPLLRGLLTKKKFFPDAYFDALTQKIIKNKYNDLSPLFENRSPNHAALQYLMHHPSISSALCGTTSSNHLNENLDFKNTQPLNIQDWNIIESCRKKYNL